MLQANLSLLGITIFMISLFPLVFLFLAITSTSPNSKTKAFNTKLIVPIPIPTEPQCSTVSNPDAGNGQTKIAGLLKVQTEFSFSIGNRSEGCIRNPNFRKRKRNGFIARINNFAFYCLPNK